MLTCFRRTHCNSCGSDQWYHQTCIVTVVLMIRADGLWSFWSTNIYKKYFSTSISWDTGGSLQPCQEANVRSLFTCCLTTIYDCHILVLLILRRQLWSRTGWPLICLQGCWWWERQRDNLVAAQPWCGPAAGVRATAPAFPEPGFVRMLHHPPSQAILQRVLVALGERLPFWIPELLHVLCPDFLGHHGFWNNVIIVRIIIKTTHTHNFKQRVCHNKTI